MEKNKEWIDNLSDDDIRFCLKNSKSIYKTPNYLKTSVMNMIRANEAAESKKKKSKERTILKPVFRYAFSFAVLLIVILAGLFITKRYILKPSNTNICKVTELSGKSYIYDKNTNEKIYLAVGEKLTASSVINTDEDSIIKFNIGDKIKVTVEENSKIELSKLFKSKDREESFLNMIFGKSVFDINKLSKTDKFAVNTESISVTVKGTEFAVSVTETGESRVSVDNGIVSVKTRMNIKNLDVIESLNADVGKKIKDIITSEIKLTKDKEFSITKDNLRKAEKEINIITAQIRKDLEENKDDSDLIKRYEKQIEKITNINNSLIGQNKTETDENKKDPEYEGIIKIEKIESKSGIVLTEKNTGITSDGAYIYISSDSNKSLYCLDPNKGKIRWVFKNDALKKITSSAEVFNNEIILSTPSSIIVLNKNGKLSNIHNISRGTNYWAKNLKVNNILYIPTFNTIYRYENKQINSIENLPEIMGQLYLSSNKKDIIFADSNAQTLKSYNIETKNISWTSNKLNGRILTEPLIIGNYIIAADMNKNIYRFDYKSKNSEPKVFNIGSGVMSNMVYKNKKLCFVANNGYFYAVNPFSFGIIKRYKAEHNPSPDKFLSKDLHLNGDDIYFSSDTGKILHYNTTYNNIELLKTNNNNPLLGSPVKIGNSIYFLDNESNIYKLTKEKI